MKIYINAGLLFLATFTRLYTFDVQIDDLLHLQHPLECTIKRSFKQNVKKPWTILIYMAADNDLAPFARKNIIQLAKVGSTHLVNILVHLDILLPGKRKTTLRYYIEKDKLIVTNNQSPETQNMDSGNPATLISALKWAIENFPADHMMLDLWNHGIGIIDVGRPRTINPSELFIFNSSSNRLDLDRSMPFLEFITSLAKIPNQRGICFDDSTGNYLSNADLIHALSSVQKIFLGGKKIDIICFDACLMAMLEVANLIKPYAHYMVASQEVELGSGYDYEKVVAPLAKHSLDPITFSKHIVKEYENTYTRITNDYTQSSIDLTKITELENIIDSIAQLLIEALKNQQNQSVKNAIKTSRHKLLCTHFDEPAYIDLHHFLSNILSNLDRFNCSNSQIEHEIKSGLQIQIKHALKLINKTVLATVAGKNLKRAQGISIYFPEFKIHASYKKTPFASQNRWSQFIARYIMA